jgi:hypothetical protein
MEAQSGSQSRSKVVKYQLDRRGEGFPILNGACPFISSLILNKNEIIFFIKNLII